jgi:hypothetical protein
MSMRILMAIVLQGLLFSAGVQIASSPAFREAYASQTPDTRTRTTADEAKRFVGEWRSLVDGPSGSTHFRIAIKVIEGKVLAVVTSELMGKNEVHDITNTEKGIALRYTSALWGYWAPVVLTPGR